MLLVFVADAGSVQQYSGGSMKLYIDRDCFDDSIDGIYCPGDYNFHYLAQTGGWRGQVSSGVTWSWLLLRDGGTDYEVIEQNPEGVNPFNVL